MVREREKIFWGSIASAFPNVVHVISPAGKRLSAGLGERCQNVRYFALADISKALSNVDPGVKVDKAHRSNALGLLARSNTTPIFVSVLHSEWQRRRAPSIMTSKNPGMPTLVDTCSAAPMSVAFLTVHGIFGDLSLVMMHAVFSKRRR